MAGRKRKPSLSSFKKRPRRKTERSLGKKTKKRAKAGKSDAKVAADIAIRYLLLLIASVNSLWIFYFLLTPLTILASSLLLGLLYPVKIYSSAIVLNDEIILNMVKACIAGSAYYLLLILNITTANIKFRKRICIFLFDAFLFFGLNVARIFILSLMQAKGIAFFDITHKIFWYGISTLYVVFIWILTVKIFRIKSIPVYSDFKFLIGQAKSR